MDKWFNSGSTRSRSLGKHLLGISLAGIFAGGAFLMRAYNSRGSISKVYSATSMLEDSDAADELQQINQEYQEFRKQWKAHGKDILQRTHQEAKEYLAQANKNDLSLGVEAETIVKTFEQQLTLNEQSPSG